MNSAKTPQKRVTQAEFARICGVNRSTVTRWIQNGRITTDAHGLIDPVAAAALRDATESPAPHHQARKAQFDETRAQNPAVQSVAPGATAATPSQNGPQARFSEPVGGEPMPQAEKLGIALKLETYKLQKAKAETANMELDKLAGLLTERAEVDFVLADFANTLRAQLENLPGRLSGPLAALRSDAALIHTALDDALRDVLHDMAAAMKQKTERLTP